MSAFGRLSIIFVIVFSTFFSWTVAAGDASAGGAAGAFRYYSVNGISYKAAAEVVTDPASDMAASWVGAIPTNKKAPAGSIGASAKLYSSSGALKCSSGWDYNDVAIAAGVSFVAECRKTLSGTFYSDGQTKAWTGSAYNTYDLARSPNQNS